MIRGIVLSTFNKSTLYTSSSFFNFTTLSVCYIYKKNHQKHNKLSFSFTKHKFCFMQINTDQQGFFFFFIVLTKLLLISLLHYYPVHVPSMRINDVPLLSLYTTISGYIGPFLTPCICIVKFV